MKRRVFGIISLVLGLVNLFLTIRFEISVWKYNRLYVFIHEFKEWSLLVLLWVIFGYFILRWFCESDIFKNDHK